MITLNSTIQRYRKTLKAAVANDDIDSLISLMDSLSEDLIQGKYHHVPYSVESVDSEKIKQIKRTLNILHLGKLMVNSQGLHNLNSFKSYEGSLFLKGLRILRKKNTAEFIRIATKVTNSPLQYPKNCDKEIKEIGTLIQEVLKEQELDQDSYFALKIIYDWRNEWEKQALRSYRRNMSISDDMSKKAALLVERLIKEKDDRIFKLLRENKTSTALFSTTLIPRFGKFITKGFLGNEDALFDLLELIYQQDPYSCLSLTACILDCHLYEENFSDQLRENCFLFAEKAINQFENKDCFIVGTALGIKYIWHPDQLEKQAAYEKLTLLIAKNKIADPEEALRWIGMLLPHSYKQADKNLEFLIGLYEEYLDKLSAEQTMNHIFPLVIQMGRIVKNSDKVGKVTLRALEKIEEIEKDKIFDGYINLALQYEKTSEFTKICINKIESLILSKLYHNPEEAARMLNRIGQISRGSARDDSFPAIMTIIEPYLKKIYALDPESIKFAKVTYGSHGTGPFQHPKYVQIFTEFVSSNR